MFTRLSLGDAGAFAIGLVPIDSSATVGPMTTPVITSAVGPVITTPVSTSPTPSPLGPSATPSVGPCDIYGAAGTPCVAAHSTTRSLFSAFNGALYQVTRGSDNSTKDIFAFSQGGIANASSQDDFCSRTTCLISIIYDQSGHNNHLTQAPAGGAARGPKPNGFDMLASATGAPAMLNGNKVYGVFSPPGTGYRNNKPNGTATGNSAEGILAVLDGTHYNDRCCYDYGSAETDNVDDGAGAMETIYFGTANRGAGDGDGPWIMADLENGVFSGRTKGKNPDNRSVPYRFVTAIVKGAESMWAIRGGNATTGQLSNFYSGPRPDGYTINKTGAIVLGIGGDNSLSGQGTFYEGVMTTGYPSDDTENSVQANIVAAGYGTAPLISGPQLTVGSSISLRVTTPNLTTYYITHDGSNVKITNFSSNGDDNLKKRATFTVRTGLGFSGCFSFESNDTPGSFLRHSDFTMRLDANDGSKLFAEDATHCPQSALNGQSGGSSIRSWNYPARYLRHFNGAVYAAINGGPEPFDDTHSFNDDVSFVASAGLA